ncbi:hypothetical protein B0H13DRAFT_2342137 [Mycena leptocephala]|nr:hypothetical protein B0H13DRAFT_2342137 [Mycena leptocephala]
MLAAHYPGSGHETLKSITDNTEPGTTQIRRPSRLSIVNSSIAYINAARRHRILASQKLRLLKNEMDALRDEVNEWLMRAGVVGVEEPRLPDSFSPILGGELEFASGDIMEAAAFRGALEGFLKELMSREECEEDDYSMGLA